MKKEKIEELWNNNLQDVFDYEWNEYGKEFTFDSFTEAINQAELEWYKGLYEKLEDLKDYDSVRRILNAIEDYHNEIQSKIKELENGHSYLELKNEH